MKGIDISQHNGQIDFSKVKKNVDFVILRLGWVGNKENHTLDTRFNEYYNECKKYKIPVGLYIYCYSNSVQNAESGANWTIKQIKGKEFELPIFIDMEDSSIRGLGKTKLTNITIAFNNIIEKNGLRAGVYANADWFNNYLDKEILRRKYTTWIAHYGLLNKNKYKGIYDMLQYISSGKVSGINSRVDMNEMYKDLIIKPNKFIEGEKVRVEMPIAIAYNNGEKSIVDNGDTQFWVSNKAIKDNMIKAEGIICYAENKNYIVQVYNDQFWCNEEYMSR